MKTQLRYSPTCYKIESTASPSTNQTNPSNFSKDKCMVGKTNLGARSYKRAFYIVAILLRELMCHCTECTAHVYICQRPDVMVHISRPLRSSTKYIAGTLPHGARHKSPGLFHVEARHAFVCVLPRPALQRRQDHYAASNR